MPTLPPRANAICRKTAYDRSREANALILDK